MMTFWHDWFGGSSYKIQGRQEAGIPGTHQVQEEPGTQCSLASAHWKLLQDTGSSDQVQKLGTLEVGPQRRKTLQG